MFIYFFEVIIVFVIGRLIYKRTYLRNRSTENRVILVNRTKVWARIFSLSVILFVLLSKILTIYIMKSRVVSSVDIFLVLGFTSILVFRCYLEIQNDVITDDALFIREGNFYFKYLENYSWNISHDLKFDEKDVKYDELLLIVKPRNAFERTFKGDKNFDVNVRVRKKDVDLVNIILDHNLKQNNSC
jgi:hypothetical protein